jgi:hypothetical protein
MSLWGSFFQHLGAAPTSINFAEVYSALQTHIVDGQENPLSLVLIAKLYEVQKYVSITNHMWDGQFTLVNVRVWKSLPENLQEVLARNFNAAAMREREDLVKVNQNVETELTKLGLQFHRTDPEMFRAAVSKAGYYKKWKATFGDEAWRMSRSTPVRCCERDTVRRETGNDESTRRARRNGLAGRRTWFARGQVSATRRRLLQATPLLPGAVAELPVIVIRSGGNDGI